MTPAAGGARGRGGAEGRGLMKKEIRLLNHEEAQLLFGRNDRRLRDMSEELGIRIVMRDGTLRLTGAGEAVEKGHAILSGMLEKIRNGAHPGGAGPEPEPAGEPAADPGLPVPDEQGNVPGDRFTFPSMGEPVRPKSAGQLKYLEAVERNDVVFCIGPAGTGKTYLAVATAVSYLRRGLLRKIVMVRPAVEAGEKLGYLPGDFQAKVNPYLRPIYDALGDFFDLRQVERFSEKEIFEIVPLAFMRGRTLNNSFIILDEAQNTTVAQMKMFLTRMGNRSKSVITGDITQTDLPPTEMSGLVHAVSMLKGIPGIEMVWMTKSDIVRHGLVGEIVEAYRRAEEASQADSGGDGG